MPKKWKWIEELGERITSDEKEEVEEALNRLREILKMDSATLNVEEVHEKERIIGLLKAKKTIKKDKIQIIRDAMESVNRSVYSISQRMHQEAAQ